MHQLTSAKLREASGLTPVLEFAYTVTIGSREADALYTSISSSDTRQAREDIESRRDTRLDGRVSEKLFLNLFFRSSAARRLTSSLGQSILKRALISAHENRKGN